MQSGLESTPTIVGDIGQYRSSRQAPQRKSLTPIVIEWYRPTRKRSRSSGRAAATCARVRVRSTRATVAGRRTNGQAVVTDRRSCARLVLLLLLAGTPAAAQVDTGTILGTVKDQSGGVLPGATVTITHEGQGFTLTTVTREDGTFIFTPIRTGAYTVEVEFPGFRKTERRGIGVSIQQTGGGRLHARDRRPHRGGGRHRESRRCSQTGTGTVGETLSSETIENLPINGRDYTILARLTHRRRAAAARRPRAADVLRQRRPAGAEQLPARRHRQQHQQRRLPERRRLHRQAAGRRGRRDQDPDQLVQRRVRPRRRRGAQHDAEVGHATSCAAACGSSTATTR